MRKSQHHNIRTCFMSKVGASQPLGYTASKFTGWQTKFLTAWVALRAILRWQLWGRLLLWLSLFWLWARRRWWRRSKLLLLWLLLEVIEWSLLKWYFHWLDRHLRATVCKKGRQSQFIWHDILKGATFYCKYSIFILNLGCPFSVLETDGFEILSNASVRWRNSKYLTTSKHKLL